ncbi:hypothetical protein [Oceanobacillus sp. FSL H7-0719]|uniref:hypothetical protein n=1 Tax=Oceanobacillus sp. FSL H7-0719 TaxID=2954507 RepID=UPI00325205D7
MKVTKNFVLTKQSDIDGFSSFKCSLCGEEFKLLSNESQEDDVYELFCPHCGIPSPPSSYITDDFVENAKVLVDNEVAKMLNDFTKDLEKTFRDNKSIKFKGSKKMPIKPLLPMYEQDNLDQIEFTCCERKAKLNTILISSKNPYCPYCGVN